MGKYIRMAIVIGVVLVAAVTLPRIVSSREEVREIVLVARDMTYYLDGKEEPNPSLRFTPGERIRLTLRNDDQGMSHDFSVRAWGVGTKVLDGKGQDTITFRVPAGSGAPVAYTCTPHTAMMNGSIVLE